MRHQLKQSGASLVELILTIVIISVALTGILSLVNQTVSHSADPMVQRQAIAIAESYLEEIMLLPVTAITDTSVVGSRSTFDNIADYHGLSDAGATDQNSKLIPGLLHYTIEVTVSDQIHASVSMKAVTVSVSPLGTDTISLTGYRADY